MKIKTADELFNYFKGKWYIIRTMEFFGKCSGEASFLQNGQRLDYSETVQISKEGFGTKAKKNYVFDLANGALTKKFENGELFYTLDIADNSARGEHLCLSDSYHATYQIKSPNSFSITYQVVTGLGDKKHADIVTEFTRDMDSDAMVIGAVDES